LSGSAWTTPDGRELRSGEADGGSAGADEANAGPRGGADVFGGEAGAAGAKVVAVEEIENEGNGAGRCAAVEVDKGAELGFEPAAEAEAGEVVAFFGDEAEAEEGGEDRVGVGLGGEEEAEVEGGVEGVFEGFVGAVAGDGGEELVDDGGAVIERTAGARVRRIGDVGRKGGGGGVH
jgi:hypothetical protein